MVDGKPQVVRSRKEWRVELQAPSGETLAFRCAHETQARFFAAVLELGPDRLPACFADRAVRVRTRSSKRKTERPAPKKQTVIFTPLELDDALAGL